VLFEIWTRQAPFFDVEGHVPAITKMVIEGGRPNFPKDSELPPHGYSRLMKECWAQEPVARPSFETVSERLDIEAQEWVTPGMDTQEGEQRSVESTSALRRLTRSRPSQRPRPGLETPLLSLADSNV